MARLIIRAEDSPGDFDMKRGHCVEVLEDGRSAGAKVEGNKRWRIIEVPGVPASAFDHLKEREAIPPDTLPEVPPRIRKIDLDALETAEATKKGRVLIASDKISLAKVAVDDVVALTPVKSGDVILPPVEKEPV